MPLITLKGHEDGTVIRGCAPEDFVEVEEAFVACNWFHLASRRQTVVGLTFEYAWHGLFIGWTRPEFEALAQAQELGTLNEPTS